mgnify:CR=1 FL=1
MRIGKDKLSFTVGSERDGHVTVLAFASDGKLYQLPDQQFANLYWFRKDWFDKPELKAKFKAKYGYDLGVPVNWSAYEDIAKFFSEDVKEIAKDVLRHRVLLTYEAEAENITSDQIVKQILQRVEVP